MIETIDYQAICKGYRNCQGIGKFHTNRTKENSKSDIKLKSHSSLVTYVINNLRHDRGTS